MDKILFIDHFKSDVKTFAMIKAAKAIGLYTILITNCVWEQNLPESVKYADLHFGDSTFIGITNKARMLIETNTDIKYIYSSTDFLIPMVNDLLLQYGFKHPLSSDTNNIHLLINKFLLNEVLLPRLDIKKIDSWMITSLEDFDRVFEQYQGPVFVKIEWGLAGGNRLDEYDCQPYDSVLAFKQHLISIQKLEKFLNEQQEGASVKEAFAIDLRFRRVVQKYIKWDESYGPYNIISNGEKIGVINHHKELIRNEGSHIMGDLIMNFDPLLCHDNYEKCCEAFDLITTRLLTTGAVNCEMWFSGNEFYISDINLRMGGANSTLAAMSTDIYLYSEEMLKPIKNFLLHVIYDEINCDFSVASLGPVCRGKLKLNKNSSISALSKDKFIEFSKSISSSQDFKIINFENLINSFAMKTTLMNVNFDVLYYTDQPERINLLKNMLEQKINSALDH